MYHRCLVTQCKKAPCILPPWQHYTNCPANLIRPPVLSRYLTPVQKKNRQDWRWRKFENLLTAICRTKKRDSTRKKKGILELLELTDTSPLADTWLVEGGRPCPSGAYPMVTCRRVAVFRKRNERVLQLSWPAAENCFSLPLSPPKSLEFPGHWVTTKFPGICLVTETV